MKIEEFYSDLMNQVRTRAEVDSDYRASSFMAEMAERMADAEEIDNLTTFYFEGTGTNRRKIAVNGYDLDDADGSIALVVSGFVDSEEIETIGVPAIAKMFDALQAFLSESLSGVFQEEREESTPEYQLAEDLRRRGRSVTRYRLYLLTNQQLSSRAKDLPSKEIAGIPVEYHVWDVQRLHQLHESARGREELIIDLREWAPDGIPALRVSDGRGSTTTYLCALPARLIADLYGRYGSRLLEGNVRSYLSARGNVNKGIKKTVMAEPDRFLAYNNGITATATGVHLSDDGRHIVGLTDLQIVNGGQTTASLFYVDRDEKNPPQFRDIAVQAKLVEVTPERAQELVPYISRYANSQNKVSEADFFSNSPFHIRMEELSRRILTPARPGVTFQTKWFYERTRGQYLNEKSKLSTADEKKFTAQYPRTQVITKTDAAKYLVSWARKPHTVSSGAQKNFVAFANEVADRWESAEADFNDDYFRHLVAKGILFNSVRSAVSSADWYQTGYLANIVTYTIAKIAETVASMSPSREFNFDAVWQRQEISDATRAFALGIAHNVLRVLTSESRPVVNVTEWAKRAECWNLIKAMPVEIPPAFQDDLVSTTEATSRKRSARQQRRVDEGIEGQAAVLAIPAEEWAAMQQYAQARRLITPAEAGILNVVMRGNLPTELQSKRLLSLRQRLVDNGYEYIS
ncbi:AIPR family protein [Nocardioides sp. J54]|uniref:AIPR family protein n=1 Tax=Nocardioides sp. J54 TaxID=935866 RepID=UPI0004901B18|nr:AIPR family protein [Nocardioides sp. J54]